MENKKVREDTEGRTWETQCWLRPETLATMADLNEECLLLLAEQSVADARGQRSVLLRETGGLLRSLDAAARRRAASACPFLLIDAGFTDHHRWAQVQACQLRELEATRQPPFFTTPGATALARHIFAYAWHLTRSQTAAARMLLGMSAHCTRLVAACTLRQMLDVAEQHPEWLRPRWPDRTQVWRELLFSAITGDPRRLEQARMRGLLMLAGEIRASLRR